MIAPTIDVDGQLQPRDAWPAAGRNEFFFSGPGIYETLLALRGRLPFATRHFKRMRRSAALLELPSPPDDRELGMRVVRLLETNALLAGPARVNLRLDPHRLLIRVGQVDDTVAGQRQAGVAAVTFETGGYAGEHKLLERGVLETARDAADRAGAAEAILVHPVRGALEGSTSSLFALAGDTLVTPPLTEGILPGVTRELVIGACAGTDLEVQERRVSPADLRSAAGLFLTSAIRLLVPVVALDGAIVGDGRPGQTLRRLQSLLLESTGT